MKKTPVAALYLDLHKGHLLIRIGYLTEKYERKTVFWQLRQLGSFNAKAIWEGVHKSVVDVPHVKLPVECMLPENEFFKKLMVFGADGASDLGVRARLRMCWHYDRLEYVFACDCFYLQNCLIYSRSRRPCSGGCARW